MDCYQGLYAYFGDIHNHCSIGYGHGSIEDAFANARTQLDFAAVTPHAVWPDIPEDDPDLTSVVDYHRQGFRQSARQWPHYLDVVRANNHPGEFVSLVGYEWHSMEYGDHTIYLLGPEKSIMRAPDLAALRQSASQRGERGTKCWIIPHHIGYHQGYRGINWQAFSSEYSPVVEIMSMHGCSEGDEGPYPYRHTMGPCDWESTMRYGLAQGHIFGVIGSTDHHSAHPGSYGHGRLSVWADELTQKGIWDAVSARRTVALTGDNIHLAVALDGHPLGSILGPRPNRTIDVDVLGGDALDYVEVLYNNRVIHRENIFSWPSVSFADEVKVRFEVGWSTRGQDVDWDIALDVRGAELRDVEPHFSGHSILEPQSTEKNQYAFSQLQRVGTDRVQIKTRTWGEALQGVTLTLRGSERSRIRAMINDNKVDVSLGELVPGSRTGYLGGFLRPAYCFHRLTPAVAYKTSFSLVHSQESTPDDQSQRDWYTVRVRQRNDQWAWSSPIWVEKSK